MIKVNNVNQSKLNNTKKIIKAIIGFSRVVEGQKAKRWLQGKTLHDNSLMIKFFDEIPSKIICGHEQKCLLFFDLPSSIAEFHVLFLS